ncbi:MAG: amidohydrolase family protein, partial [Gammaproteobacteria bacterium]
MMIASRSFSLAMLIGSLACQPGAAMAGGHDTQPPVKIIKPAPLFIQNVQVWDGTADSSVAGLDVLIEDGLITSITSAQAPPENAELIDGGGRVLIPGIIDAHSHIAIPLGPKALRQEDPGYVAALSTRAARLYLMRGWTTLRDIGGPSQGLARAIDEGIVDGPRIYPSAAFISQTSGHGDHRGLTEPHPNVGGPANQFVQRYTQLADGPAEVRRATRESLRQGATQIKVMAGGGISSDYDPIDTTQYSLEELRAAVESAEDWNTYVAVHAYTDAAVNRSLDAGVKVIEHGHLVSKKTLKRIKSEGAFLSSQSFGFARIFIKGNEALNNTKAGQVMAGTDNLMNNAKKLGLPVAFGTDAVGSMRAYEAGIKEFGYRLRWFDSLEILKQATS